MLKLCFPTNRISVFTSCEPYNSLAMLYSVTTEWMRVLGHLRCVLSLNQHYLVHHLSLLYCRWWYRARNMNQEMCWNESIASWSLFMVLMWQRKSGRHKCRCTGTYCRGGTPIWLTRAVASGDRLAMVWIAKNISTTASAVTVFCFLRSAAVWLQYRGSWCVGHYQC